jgi:hypothetical protein
MKVKKLVSMLAVVGTMFGAAFALSAEPVSHDHQATKSNFKTPSASKRAPTEKCAPQVTEDDSEENADTKADNATSEKCQPEKSKEKLHDHRDMKNL